jgi:hypothetical protein
MHMPTKKKVGRPSLGKVKVTLLMSEEAKSKATELAKSRGMALGTLFSELVRLELERAS